MEKLKNMLSSGNNNKEDETNLEGDSSLRRPGQIAGEGSHFGSSRGIAETPAGVAQRSEVMPGSFGDDQPRADSVTSPTSTATSGTAVPSTGGSATNAVPQRGTATQDMPRSTGPLQSTTSSNTSHLASSNVTGATNTPSLASIATQSPSSTTHASTVGKGSSTAPQIPPQEFGDSTVSSRNVSGVTGSTVGSGLVGSDTGISSRNVSGTTGTTATGVESGAIGSGSNIASRNVTGTTGTPRTGVETGTLGSDPSVSSRNVSGSTGTALGSGVTGLDHGVSSRNVSGTTGTGLGSGAIGSDLGPRDTASTTSIKSGVAGDTGLAHGHAAAGSTTNRPGYATEGNLTGNDVVTTSHTGHQTGTTGRSTAGVIPSVTSDTAAQSTTNRPGFATSGDGLTGRDAAGTSTLPIRSGDGTHADIGQTYTARSFPLNTTHEGPHETATANILDPHVNERTGHSTGTTSGVIPAGTSTTTSTGTGSHLGRDTGIVGTSGAGAGVAGYETSQHHGASTQPATGIATSDRAIDTSATSSTHPEKTHHYGRDAAVAGATGATGAGAAHEYEKQRNTTTSERDPVVASHSGYTEHKRDTDTSHTGRDAAIGAGGAGAVGAGAYEYEKHHKTTEAEREAQKSLGHTTKDSTDPNTRTTSGKENVGGVVSPGTVGGSAIEAEHDDKHHSKLQKKKEKEEEDEAKKDKRKSGGILGFLHRDKKDSDKDETSRKSEESSSSKHHHGKETAAAGGAGAVGAGTAYEAGKHEHHTHPEPVGHDRGHQSSMFNTSTPHDRGSVATDAGYGGTIKRSQMEHGGTHDHHQTGTVDNAGRTGTAAGTGAALGTGATTTSYLAHGKGEPIDTTDTGPASKTIGPHSSNVANIVDPRVKPDPALMKEHTTVGPHQSDTLNKLDPKVEADPQKAAEKQREQTAAIAGGGALGAVGATSGSERHATSGTDAGKHTTSRDHTTTTTGTDAGKHTTGRDYTTSSTTATHHEPKTEYERIGGVPDTRTSSDVAGGQTGRSDEYGEGEYGRTSAEQHERSGLSKLLHRDNPNKLHKDPPEKR